MESTRCSVQRPFLPLLLAILISLSSCVWILRFPFTLDDAYITFHYARNLAYGLPLGTWNAGEPPVEGFSSMLWTLIISMGMLLHISPFYLSKLLGYLCAAGMPVVTYFVYRSSIRSARTPLIDPEALACAAIMLAGSVPLYYYAATGMEADLFSFLVLCVLIAPNITNRGLRLWVVTLVSAALVFTRPEGLLVAGVVNVYWLAHERGRTRTWAVSGLVATVAAGLVLLSFRVHYFHALVPNTYFAKGSGGSALHRIALGARYLLRTVQLLAPTSVALGVALWRYRATARGNRFVPLLLILGAIYTVYVLKVGGDPDSAFPLRRHFVHIAAVIALLFGAVVASTNSSRRRMYGAALAITIATGVWVTVGWCLKPLVKGFEVTKQDGLFRPEPPEPTWAWFARYSSARTLTAVTGAGEWPYLVPGRYIDMLGLNDRHIAMQGTVDTASRFQDSKTDMNYVLSRRPDIIDGYVNAQSLLENRCPNIAHSDRTLMLNSLRNNPIFQNEYVFVVNGPYSEWTRAVFVRSAYLKQIHAGALRTVPVLKTSLYKEGCD